jgi:ATP-dependent RNA helicase DDX46/PRP5
MGNKGEVVLYKKKQQKPLYNKPCRCHLNHRIGICTVTANHPEHTFPVSSCNIYHPMSAPERRRRRSRFASAEVPTAAAKDASATSDAAFASVASSGAVASPASTLLAAPAERVVQKSPETRPTTTAPVLRTDTVASGTPVKPAAFRIAPRRGRGPAKRLRTALSAPRSDEHDDDDEINVNERKPVRMRLTPILAEHGSAAPPDVAMETSVKAAPKSSDAVDFDSIAKSFSIEDAGDEIDPLDVYMQDISARAAAAGASSGGGGVALVADVEIGAEEGYGGDGDDEANLAVSGVTGTDALGREGVGYLDRAKQRKRPVYERVDHSKIQYAPFQKDLYHEVPALARMTPEEVQAARRALGSVRIRGRRCPKPVASFGQCGLPSSVLDVIRKAQYAAPTPIQAQAIPCIMSGRDVIGVAKTGSGKTLAFVLPVLRHVALQARPLPGEGPIALLVAPTRELAIQIYGEAKRFARALELRCVCAYGGSGVKDQIAELKRGADIVICTPGRMIDLLAMNSGRITNLGRVTIVVLDEADRMFDMGFEPQLTRLVENVRPDRQTVMFSATFPPQVEKLARKVLVQPVEIMIGGNSVAAPSIDQKIEVRSEESKFFRLLQLLGVWYDKGSSLVFVDRQDNADRIFKDLSQAGYLCLSLHGGMDQADRDSALADFKNGDVKVLVATSVAARGLDIKHLTLVVNYDVPNHYEDYVHRVGRTGRAGRTGTAHTFITPEQDMFAGDMVKALQQTARASVTREGLSKEEDKAAGDEAAAAAVPEELRRLAASFLETQDAKRKAGIAVHSGGCSGYGGRGFTFDENEENATAALRKSQAKRFKAEVNGGEASDSDDDRGGDGAGDMEIKVVQRLKPSTTAATPVSNGVRNDANSDEKAIDSSVVAISIPAGAGRALSMVEAADEARGQAEAEGLDAAATAERIRLAKAAVLSNLVSGSKTRASADPPPPLPSTGGAGGAAMSAAAAAAAALSAKLGGGSAGGDGGISKTTGSGGIGADVDAPCFEAELEINDFPQHARWRVTHANALTDVTENTGCVVTARGNFYAPGRNPPEGERKLHLLIEGEDERSVKAAYKEIKLKLEEASASRSDSKPSYGKYSVV